MSIANKLSYLNQTKNLIRESINNIGGNLTSSNTFRSYVAELQNIYNRLPKISNEGTSFILSPTLGNDKLNIIGKGNLLHTGEPTPINPQPIKVVTGDNKVIVRTANLFDKDSAISGFYNQLGEIGSSSNWRYEKIKINNINPIIVSGTSIENTTACFVVFDKNNNYINYLGNYTQITQNSYQLPSNAYYLGISCHVNDLDTLQVEYGTTATPYVPYKRQELPLNLGSMEFAIMGNYQDEFVLENDTWYKDKKINKYIFTGNENFAYQSVYKRFNATSILVGKEGKGQYNILSNIFQPGNSSVGTDVTADNVLWLGYNAVDNYTGISIRCLAYDDDVTSFKNMLIGNYFMYVLTTPVREEITNSSLISQLNAIYNAISYSDKTYIETESEEENAQLIVSANCLRGIGNI